jgi:formate/nitrite transporter FocA (FNT family)
VTAEDADVDAKATEAESLDAETTYEVIKREGLSELERATSALFWSGLAAGLSMGFSFLAEGLLRSHLPDAEWRLLIAKAGYSVGFLIVILGSQQLFTENTLTPIVPLLHEWSARRLRDVARLWGAVLVANLIGALLFATALAELSVAEPATMHAFSELAAEAMRFGPGVILLHAVYAGWLIALMVWMLPGAETAKAFVIVVMTYLVGIGGFAHVIAGSTEVLYAAVRGDAAVSSVVFGYILPALLGNIIGGLTMVTALNHAQATSGE